MDNHPIPQDVTGFQFRLIGNMTLKQFAYVAIGVVISVILYYAPINIIFKALFIPLFGGGGILIAFVPIEGRPIDLMLGNFIKSLFSPNQFVYHKTGRTFSFTMLPSTRTTGAPNKPEANAPIQEQGKEQKLQTLLQASQNKAVSSLDAKEAFFIQSLAAPSVVTPLALVPSDQGSTGVISPALQPATPPEDKPITESLADTEKHLNQELTQAKTDHADNSKITQLEKQIQELHAQREYLQQQLQKLQTQPEPIVPPQQSVRNIPKDMTKSAGLPHVSDTPNVIVGIVKDPRGNVLPGMLVEVKDKNGNPVRAFKTNQLGQFASATPLASGVYALTLEDPRKQHSFDSLQIIASNQILLPFEIISHDAREQLRKDLFN